MRRGIVSGSLHIVIVEVICTNKIARLSLGYKEMSSWQASPWFWDAEVLINNTGTLLHAPIQISQQHIC